MKDRLVSKFEKLKEGDHNLSLSIAQPILRGMIKVVAPELIDDTHEGFSMSMRWTREFVKFYMNWTFRKGTTTANKVFIDWVK